MCGILAPNTFLIPISLALLNDLAVDRFIKFAEAIASVINAKNVNIRILFKVPSPFSPRSLISVSD